MRYKRASNQDEWVPVVTKALHVWPRLSVMLAINGTFIASCDRVAEAKALALSSKSPKGLVCITLKLPHLDGVTSGGVNFKREVLRFTRDTTPGSSQEWRIDSSFD